MYHDLIHRDLFEIMRMPLQGKTYQKRLLFRPLQSEVEHVYYLLNRDVFGGKLTTPEIQLKPKLRRYWGMCIGEHFVQKTGSFCKVELLDKWTSPQWLVMILAHEMCHQYQWDIIGEERISQKKEKLMSHGPSFFQFRERLADLDIPLRRRYSMHQWHATQNLWKT